MGGPDTIGWIASAILIATLSRQIYNQWRNPDEKGVSTWLFIGQTAASVGFIVYSALLVNWVFIVTNSLILVTALVGQAVVWRNKRRQRAGHASTS
jgi:MtN3 and saliva related transmembrane protein